MATRLKLIVAYDGALFSGWQSQPNANGIQDHLEKAFEQICSRPVRVHGAGRTDAGVHALAQCAHVDLPVRRYGADRWRSALNGILPPAIRIMECRFVSDSFHARFSAKKKIYRYRVWNGEVLPPLENGRAWHVRDPIDRETVAAAAKLFIGEHDFASFSANRGRPTADTVRKLFAVRFRESGAILTFDFEGEGFLYKMVRMIMGGLIQVGVGKASLHDIQSRLAHPRRAIAAERNVAPAGGLFLFRVRY
ncbi:MAG TPA: tRNA pseudouridine(38-40) synthase TruA [Chthoniobacterales bacterium]|jgi:tRNA pseudouridine38-40 synthase|nr:tRNA pseudouridine(38-40) synthase TruA [Chthoniobacterales bacterium]